MHHEGCVSSHHTYCTCRSFNISIRHLRRESLSTSLSCIPLRYAPNYQRHGQEGKSRACSYVYMPELALLAKILWLSDLPVFQFQARFPSLLCASTKRIPHSMLPYAFNKSPPTGATINQADRSTEEHLIGMGASLKPWRTGSTSLSYLNLLSSVCS